MKEDQLKVIKSITKYVCPHCENKIFVSVSINQPLLHWVITEEQLLKNKEDLRRKLRGYIFPNKETEDQIMEEIKSEEFLLGIEDVDDILTSLIKTLNLKKID